jgi:Ca-activated chloride channel homolog
LIVAVARPQKADESSQIYAEGIAIEMVVDTSSSMNDEDLSPRGQRQTRLDVVKDVFRRFVAGDGGLPGRPNDLIGMIRFAKFADSILPLTLDHKAVLDVLERTNVVRSQSEEDGTAIGDGLALAVERMKDLKRTSGSGEQLKINSRVIILLTDGENREGIISPRQAGELAAINGIKVYAIMAGTGAYVAPGFPRQPIDTSDLKFIADATGGQFFQARDG